MADAPEKQGIGAEVEDRKSITRGMQERREKHHERHGTRPEEGDRRDEAEAEEWERFPLPTCAQIADSRGRVLLLLRQSCGIWQCSAAYRMERTTVKQDVKSANI